VHDQADLLGGAEPGPDVILEFQLQPGLLAPQLNELLQEGRHLGVLLFLGPRPQQDVAEAVPDVPDLPHLLEEVLVVAGPAFRHGPGLGFREPHGLLQLVQAEPGQGTAILGRGLGQDGQGRQEEGGLQQDGTQHNHLAKVGGASRCFKSACISSGESA